MNKVDEKRKDAIALKYQSKFDTAPKVVAKGKGLIADKIVSRAKDFGVPIQEEPSIVEVLSNLEINQQIPKDLYNVVAEVFAFIYRADKQIKN